MKMCKWGIQTKNLCTFIIHFTEYLPLISIDFLSPNFLKIYPTERVKNISKTICIFIVSANEFRITISKWNGYLRSLVLYACNFERFIIFAVD